MADSSDRDSASRDKCVAFARSWETPLERFYLHVTDRNRWQLDIAGPGATENKTIMAKQLRNSEFADSQAAK